MGAITIVTKIFIGKPKGNKPLGRPRHRKDDSTRILEWILET